MYYVGVAAAPSPTERSFSWRCSLPAAAATSTPSARGRATGRDAAVRRPISSVSVPASAPYQLIGFATMSDLGGEPDGGSDAAPTLLLDGGVSGGGASTPKVVDAAEADALAQFTMYASDKMPGPLTIVVKGMITVPPRLTAATPAAKRSGCPRTRPSSAPTPARGSSAAAWR